MAANGVAIGIAGALDGQTLKPQSYGRIPFARTDSAAYSLVGAKWPTSYSTLKRFWQSLYYMLFVACRSGSHQMVTLLIAQAVANLLAPLRLVRTACQRITSYVVLSAILCLGTISIAGESDRVDSVTKQSSRNPVTEDTKVIAIESLRHWLSAMDNFHAECEIRVYNCEYVEGVRGQRVGDSGWHHFNYKRIGGKYRLDAQWYDTQDAIELTTDSISTYDNRLGASRAFATHAEVQGKYGRIDVKHDGIIWANRLRFWVGGKNEPVNAGWITSLLSHSDEASFVVPDGQENLVVTVPIKKEGTDARIGERSFWLDPNRGYLLVRMKGEINDGEYWRKESLVVESTKDLGDGIWFPTAIEEELQTSALGASVISIFETTVANVQLGAVSHDDLELVFPPNTEVIDVVKGVSYTADGNGGMIGESYPLIGGMVAADPDMEKIKIDTNDDGFRWGTVLIVMNVGVGFCVLGIWLIRRSRVKKV